MDMKANENRVPGEGNVTIILGGKEETLVPSYEAAKAISRTYGGIGRAVDMALAVNIEVIKDTIFLGLGYGPNKRPPRGLEEKIWAEGFTDDTGALVDKVVLFLRVLSAGGRMPKDAIAGGADGGESGDDENPRTA
jgi:hypothetical protein